MLEFFRSAFRGLFAFCMIIGIIGVVIGAFISFSLHVGLGILSLVVGFIFLVLTGGMASTILYMDENLELIKQKIDKIESKSSLLLQSPFASSGNRTIVGNKLQKKCKQCKKEVDEDYTGCPYCGNNTFE
jgi:uncharacterized membrane protein required for colicin V production